MSWLWSKISRDIDHKIGCGRAHRHSEVSGAGECAGIADGHHHGVSNRLARGEVQSAGEWNWQGIRVNCEIPRPRRPDGDHVDVNGLCGSRGDGTICGTTLV